MVRSPRARERLEPAARLPCRAALARTRPATAPRRAREGLDRGDQ